MRASFFMNHLKKILLVEIPHNSLEVKNIFTSSIYALIIRLTRQIDTYATIQGQADDGGSQKWCPCYANSRLVRCRPYLWWFSVFVSLNESKFPKTGISQICHSGSSAEEILSVRLEAKLRKPALETDECVISWSHLDCTTCLDSRNKSPHLNSSKQDGYTRTILNLRYPNFGSYMFPNEKRKLNFVLRLVLHFESLSNFGGGHPSRQPYLSIIL